MVNYHNKIVMNKKKYEKNKTMGRNVLKPIKRRKLYHSYYNHIFLYVYLQIYLQTR